MYIIVVGAGAAGASLIEIATQEGHEVALIEKREDRARNILKQYDTVEVFHTDIAQGGILDEADAHRADVLVATTSDDSANLMAMVLGKEYEVERLIAMVNNIQHQAMFERLGVKVLVNPEEIIARYLYRLLNKESEDNR